MRLSLLLVLALLLGGPACSQASGEATTGDPPPSRPDLDLCDGCEEAFARTPDDLGWRATLPPEGEPGERLVVSGRVVGSDGETPAPGVVLYFHQTNAEGLYQSRTSTARGGPTDGMIDFEVLVDGQTVDSTEKLAAAFAFLVNDDSAAGLAAEANGSTLFVTSTAAAASVS